MSPELSIRVAAVLLILEDQLELEDFLAFKDRTSSCATFEDLSKEDQDLILKAEKRLRREKRTAVQEMDEFKVTVPYDYIETKELRLSSVYNYRMGGPNGEIVAKRVVHFEDESKERIVGREIRDIDG